MILRSRLDHQTGLRVDDRDVHGLDRAQGQVQAVTGGVGDGGVRVVDELPELLGFGVWARASRSMTCAAAIGASEGWEVSMPLMCADDWASVTGPPE